MLTFSNSFAQNPPSGFASVTVSNQWNEAVGLTFGDDGTEMFVWERGGRVWVVKNNQKQLLIDISDEVGAFHDHGLIGFALHPQFNQNGYFYLFYLVDRHHLINYGTAAYDPGRNEYFAATIGRLTRYTAMKTPSGYAVDHGSRKILIGATKSTGVPSTNTSHVTGGIVFGTDGTLLVGTGDGAGPYYDLGSGSNGWFAQALADGIITPTENIGVFRSQLLDCHNGKILRIDPETGEGIPSNPFYDPARPSAAISKVYALGIRQPFKITIKPGTGSHNPADGNPGTIYMGDVGYNTWEEINVIDKPGLNLGWPIFEGLEPSEMFAMLVANKTAPNPLYQINGCTREFFNFQDLLKQATASGQVSFPNPCNVGQNVPSSIKTFSHHRPVIDWIHGGTLRSRTGIFNGELAGVINIGAPGSPVAGPLFSGSAAVGGVFYPHSDFPPEYQNEYFFGDYSYGWLRHLDMDENDKPVQVRNFINSGAIVVGMAVHPTQGGLYYINFPSEIRKVSYSSNRPPEAAASVDNTFGASPFIAQLTGGSSTDPEGQPLTYEWNFGDGTPLSTEANPIHTFTAPSGGPIEYTVTLKVTDNLGASDQTTLSISLNNTPPKVTIDSPVDGTLYPLNQETTYLLQATVTDDEHALNQLTFEWQTFLHHNNHSHPNPKVTSPSSSLTVDPLGCDGQIYYYRIVLKVTDAAGASTTREVKLHPDCENIPLVTPVITWSLPPSLPVGTVLGSTQLNATATHNGSPVPGTFEYTPPSGTVLALGNAQQLSVTFTPGNPSLYNPVSKTVTIDVVEVSLVTPVITWATPASITVGTALSATQLNATASYNGSPVAGTFAYTPGVGTVLGLGNAQQLSVSFTP
ncbi:MAG TPA: PQQ-dependent sugar dehydrogenase, partial [Chryseolinea sp.]|nr:PQQ-dependent sugar dehydrogenase [Chryseolinea sp.]